MLRRNINNVTIEHKVLNRSGLIINLLKLGEIYVYIRRNNRRRTNR